MDKHLFRGLGVILLALALSGCWLQLGGGPANDRFNSAESDLTRDDVDSLAVEWRTPVDSIMTEPLVSGGRVHVATRKYDDSGSTLDVLAVQTYAAGTGALAWETSLLPTNGTDVAGLVETPALAGGALWVPYWHDGMGPCEGRLARLDPATGAILSSDVTGTSPSAVVVAGDAVAYMDQSCSGVRVVVRDLATRAVRWTHTFPAGSSITTPTIADGRLFLLTGDVVYAFDADGCGTSVCAPLWTEAVTSTFFDFQRLVAGPDDTLVTIGRSSAPEAGSTVVVRDAATGDVRWEAEPRYTGSLPGAITGIAVAYDTIYVAGSTTGPEPFDREAVLDAYAVGGCGQPVCSPTSTTGFGATRPAREPTVAGGVVYVPLVAGATSAPAVAAADAHGCGAATCSELGRVPLVAGSVFLEAAQPYVTSVGGGRVLVGWLPSLHGSTQSQLISLAPTEG